MRFKLTELFNTKYFYVTTGRDLTYMLNTCLALRANSNLVYNVGSDALKQVYECFKSGAPVEFDLAEARITSDVCISLNEYAKQGIKFVDTASEWRDKLLRDNESRIAVDLSKAVPLPTYTAGMNAVDYIASLSKDVTYLVEPTNLEIQVPLLTLILIYRPSIKLVLNTVADDVFRYVSDFFTIDDLKQYDEFYVSEPEGVFIWKKGEPLYIQRIRDKVCSFEDAQTVADFVPTVFGKERLNNNPTFRLIAGDCNARLNHYRAALPVALSDVL